MVTAMPAIRMLFPRTVRSCPNLERPAGVRDHSYGLRAGAVVVGLE